MSRTSPDSRFQSVILRGWDPDNVEEAQVRKIQDSVDHLELSVLDLEVIGEAPMDDVSSDEDMSSRDD